GEYLLTTLEDLGDGVHRVTLDTLAYPYGGIGALIAVVEAFGGYPEEWCDDASPAVRRR
ncbi:MAG: hypothetical protein ACI8S6_005310, partial [Myxococcota bacterium]